MKARAKTVFIHKNHEDVIQLPTDNNGVTLLYVRPTRDIVPPNEVEWAEVKADYNKL